MENQSFIVGQGNATEAEYQALYNESITNNEEFWRKQGQRIDWIKPYTKISDFKYSKQETYIKWYYDGTLNVSYNCIDRHIKNGKQNNVAIIWEGNDPTQSLKITYQELHDKVCQLANAYKALGIKKGDRVTIYLPMIPEIAYAMLACARIGAVHSVIFGGFSPDSISDRVDDCKSEWVITADEGVRGVKATGLKANVDAALLKCKQKVKKVLVVKATGGQIQWFADRDVWYHDLVNKQPKTCPPEEMQAEDPLFILYTSGSTGKPKGVLHTQGGYIVYASLTHHYVFGYRPGEIYWCTADCGWVTGHTYIIYGPLANAATTLLFEGVPNYPTSSRFWEVCDKHQVNIFYTAPTALRSLMKEGEALVKKTKRTSLRVLGSVGEPINPEAWLWYFNVVGEGRCPIVDTWWQTETGGIMITPLAGLKMKPGCATRPFFGVKPLIVDEKGKVVETTEATGSLVIAQSWPGQMRTVYGNHKRFLETYFSQFDGYYFSGDGCRRDADGFHWITGRVDDIIIVSGHNLGTAEIESALVAHKTVAEAAVVGFPHEIKGSGIYCFVTLKEGVQGNEKLEKELVLQVRNIIGAFGAPDFIQFAPGLPKTRSGKIMRRILRKVAENDFQNLGDITTLADPSVVTDIVNGRKNKHLKAKL